jgi:hypothetical protein
MLGRRVRYGLWVGDVRVRGYGGGAPGVFVVPLGTAHDALGIYHNLCSALRPNDGIDDCGNSTSTA